MLQFYDSRKIVNAFFIATIINYVYIGTETYNIHMYTCCTISEVNFYGYNVFYTLCDSFHAYTTWQVLSTTFSMTHGEKHMYISQNKQKIIIVIMKIVVQKLTVDQMMVANYIYIYIYIYVYIFFYHDIDSVLSLQLEVKLYNYRLYIAYRCKSILPERFA